jgi:hypothetical protein
MHLDQRREPDGNLRLRRPPARAPRRSAPPATESFAAGLQLAGFALPVE